MKDIFVKTEEFRKVFQFTSKVLFMTKERESKTFKLLRKNAVAVFLHLMVGSVTAGLEARSLARVEVLCGNCQILLLLLKDVGHIGILTYAALSADLQEILEGTSPL